MRYNLQVVVCLLALIHPVCNPRTTFAEDVPELAAARAARDRADTEALRKLLESARAEAVKKNNAANWQKVAQIAYWLTEAAHAQNDDKLIKRAAEDGLSAAEKEVSLDPNSSEAHRLTGDLLGELIPHTFMGGMRLGKRAARELDKAIELDPRNANAYIGRAIGYYFTPPAFGGSHEKAAELLKKAIEIDAANDTAHIWLAQVNLSEGRHDDAAREIAEALRINPDRAFSKRVQQLILTRNRR
jgi:tetratricopeptide (TPR) repeat protein